MCAWLDGFGVDSRVLGDLVIFKMFGENVREMLSLGCGVKDPTVGDDYAFYVSNLFCYMDFTSSAWLLGFRHEKRAVEFI